MDELCLFSGLIKVLFFDVSMIECGNWPITFNSEENYENAICWNDFFVFVNIEC